MKELRYTKVCGSAMRQIVRVHNIVLQHYSVPAVEKVHIKNCKGYNEVGWEIRAICLVYERFIQ